MTHSDHKDSQHPQPGVSREARISDEGLQRLDKQLRTGAKMNRQVLAQWVRRYGDAARVVIRQNGIEWED